MVEKEGKGLSSVALKENLAQSQWQRNGNIVAILGMTHAKGTCREGTRLRHVLPPLLVSKLFCLWWHCFGDPIQNMVSTPAYETALARGG